MSSAKPKHGKFVKLDDWLQNTEAWRSLDPVARCTFIEMLRLYNGKNNGEIAMACRQAGKLVNVTKSTAARALNDLQSRGFIRVTRAAELKMYRGAPKRFATSYALTHLPVGSDMPSQEFISWTADGKSNVIPLKRVSKD